MSSQAFISNATASTLAAVGDGYSVPRMPTAQRLAITFTTSDQGMMVYDTTLNNLFIWNGSAWESVPASGDSTDTQVIFNDNGILVGDSDLTFNSALNKLIATNIESSASLVVGTSATISGDLTVDTSTLKVDSTNNRVGIGTATPGFALDILGASGLGIRIYESSTGNNNRLQITQTGTDSTFNSTYSAGSGAFAWQIASAELMRLNSTGLGIGVTPSARFHSKAGAVTQGGIIETTGANALLSFADAGTSSYTRVQIGSSGNNLAAFINSVQAMTLDASGNLLTGGKTSATANGGDVQVSSGITFPATQVAKSDANTLDDYEEGTFTATLKGSVSDPTTPVTFTGRYTKIGRQVNVNIYMAGVTTTGASGRIQIDGLPFANSSAADAICIVAFSGMATFTGSPFGVVVPSGTIIYMQSSVSGTAYTSTTFNTGTGQTLWVSLTYNV